MSETIYYSKLYDLYKGMFTEHQKHIFSEYFFENLTLEEIAVNEGVSKNAISKTIKSMRESLEGYEKNIHVLEYLESIRNEFKNEEDILKRIEKYDKIIL